MLITGIGAFIGALLTLFISILIEFERKPKLSLEIETPPFDHDYGGPIINDTRFLRVALYNRPMLTFFKWLGRNPALHCSGVIQFHHILDGVPLFSTPMQLRWSYSNEPLSQQLMPNGEMKLIFDLAKYSASFTRDCYPGTRELIDVAARFNKDSDCYGWSNDSYIPGKGWRNTDWKLPKDRYIVTIIVYSSGDSLWGAYKLENSSDRENFRLLPATKDDIKKVAPYINLSSPYRSSTKIPTPPLI